METHVAETPSNEKQYSIRDKKQLNTGKISYSEIFLKPLEAVLSCLHRLLSVIILLFPLVL